MLFSASAGALAAASETRRHLRVVQHGGVHARAHGDGAPPHHGDEARVRAVRPIREQPGRATRSDARVQHGPQQTDAGSRDG